MDSLLQLGKVIQGANLGLKSIEKSTLNQRLSILRTNWIRLRDLNHISPSLYKNLTEFNWSQWMDRADEVIHPRGIVAVNLPGISYQSLFVINYSVAFLLKNVIIVRFSEKTPPCEIQKCMDFTKDLPENVCLEFSGAHDAVASLFDSPAVKCKNFYGKPATMDLFSGPNIRLSKNLVNMAVLTDDAGATSDLNELCRGWRELSHLRVQWLWVQEGSWQKVSEVIQKEGSAGLAFSEDSAFSIRDTAFRAQIAKEGGKDLGNGIFSDLSQCSNLFAELSTGPTILVSKFKYLHEVFKYSQNYPESRILFFSKDISVALRSIEKTPCREFWINPSKNDYLQWSNEISELYEFYSRKTQIHYSSKADRR